eukprot:TRINITY_DN64058_c0_g1_i1.p1 TRINITY_DN64058_c0_g1~~TRINITY_DN64058_c0_g1_i1.p1  ORF type:complete len:309 (-),score=37.55 TRINITY_DN64058_c0_g1_i1:140-1066(-)
MMAAGGANFTAGRMCDMRDVVVQRTFIHDWGSNVSASHQKRTSSTPAIMHFAWHTCSYSSSTSRSSSSQELDLHNHEESESLAGASCCRANVACAASAHKQADTLIQGRAQAAEHLAHIEGDAGVVSKTMGNNKRRGSRDSDNEIADGSMDTTRVSRLYAKGGGNAADVLEADKDDRRQSERMPSGIVDETNVSSSRDDDGQGVLYEDHIFSLANLQEKEFRSSIVSRLRGNTMLIVYDKETPSQEDMECLVHEHGCADTCKFLYVRPGFALINFLTASIAVDFAVKCEGLRNIQCDPLNVNHRALLR